MSGGIFQSQNKIRAGAYINFKSVPKPMTTVGTRGVSTIAIPLSWGDKLTELYSTDLTDETSLDKVGLYVTDEQALILRKLLSHCYKTFLYRLDTGGVKASATVGEQTFTALYEGTFGNDIVIVITQDLYAYEGSTTGLFYTDQPLQVGTVAYSDVELETVLGVVTQVDETNVKIGEGTAETYTQQQNENILYTVQTIVKGVRKDSQAVYKGTELVDNKFVHFGDSENLQSTAGTPLTGGTDGQVEDTTYLDYLEAISEHKFDTMGLPYATSNSVLEAAKLFITQQNEKYGRKCKLVVHNYPSDTDYIINSINGYRTTQETVTPEIFVAEVTGLDAGAAINQSLTYTVVADKDVAVDIIDNIPEKYIESELLAGKFILSKRDDGAIVIEKDINSLHTFTAYKDYAFSKNRVKRTLDEIANTVKLTWEKNYVGKVDNNESSRDIFKGDIINYLNILQNTYSAIQNFDSTKDIEVLPGNDIDAVVCNLGVQPVDSMEKLYMTVTVNG